MEKRFNFKYIKDLASPGSWRRGYEYYQKNMVLDKNLVDNVVEASVKGNFQDKYTIKLILDNEKISAQCDCPLEEEWCKHAVAVGLVSINEHFYETYLNRLFNEQLSFPDENTPEIIHPKGSYKFTLKNNPKHISIQIIERLKDQVVTDVEGILRAVLALQNSDSEFPLNETQKLELSFMQFLYKNSRFDRQKAYYNIPINKYDEALKFLSCQEEVY